MTAGPEKDNESTIPDRGEHPSGISFAVALAAIAAVAAGIAIQQILQRRLSKPEVARLRFYRYLRERGHLES